MHTYGLALDIKYAGNPFVQGARFTEALKHAALLVGGLAITQRTSEAFFASLAGTGDTASVYRAVSLYDGYFRRYLALRNQRDELREILQRWEASRSSLTPPGIFARGTESVDQALTRWQRIIRRDYEQLSSGAAPFLARDPLKGFLNLPQELVMALRDKACLAWGAVDFGVRDSGGVMHFDARVCGIGDRLAEVGGNYRVSQDHPCFPRADSNDRAWHTVIVVERTSSSNEHTFLVDASWGVDLYGADAGGVGRRKFVHDTSSGRWWDIHPIYGTKAHENAIGPYDGHPIHGMFRAKHKK
jgi:hypothetical protein